MDVMKLEDVVDQLHGRLVFLRIDINTTASAGEFTVNERLKRAVPTLRMLQDAGARTIVGAHLARPDEPSFMDTAYVARFFAGETGELPKNERLNVIWRGNTYDAPNDRLNSTAEKTIKNLNNGEALILNNIRMLPGEMTYRGMNRYERAIMRIYEALEDEMGKNPALQKHFDAIKNKILKEGSALNWESSPENFAKTPFIVQLLNFGLEAYVNDAFSVSHRVQRSIMGFRDVPNFAGPNLVNELGAIEHLRGDFVQARGRRTFALGGMKIQDYFPFIQYVAELQGEVRILCGGMLGMLGLDIRGVDVGYQTRTMMLKEDSKGKTVMSYRSRLETLMREHPDVFVLPVDLAYEVGCERREADVSSIPEELRKGHPAYDIGLKTAEIFSKIVRGSTTAFMKGTMGNIDYVRDDLEETGNVGTGVLRPFSHGSRAVVAAMMRPEVYSMLGGGDSSAFASTIMNGEAPEGEIDFVSVSGGALLEALAGKGLPGILRLEESKKEYEGKPLFKDAA